MPVITVEIFEGRSLEQKKMIVEGITSVFTKLNIPPNDIHVFLKENPQCNVAMGGKLWSEIHKP